MPGMSAHANGVSLSVPWWVWHHNLTLGVDSGVAFCQALTSAMPCWVWFHVVLGVTTELPLQRVVPTELPLSLVVVDSEESGQCVLQE